MTQAEEIVLRFRTSKPLGLLLITSTGETGDRIELAVAAGRIRMALRLGVRDRKPEDKEKDKVGKGAAERVRAWRRSGILQVFQREPGVCSCRCN